MDEIFEVAAIQFSHKEEKIEEWCKSKTIYYFKTWWHGYDREWTIEPLDNFQDSDEMRANIRTAINSGSIVKCVGCRKSARIAAKSIGLLESNRLTGPSLAKHSDESGSLIHEASSIVLVDPPMSLTKSVPIRFMNSGKDYCVLYALLNLIDHSTVKDRENLLKGPLKGFKMFGLEQLASKV